MTEWEPATDAELAMRDALRTDDQESYFRVLSGTELLLPVSAEALAGLAPVGWGTWSSGGRTHVLAFTSPAALQACLTDYAGSARRIAYADLAETWPNLEWWLAVNPGLPIEGYLPAWFVAQLARGDLRLPVRGPRRDASTTRDTPAAAGLAESSADGAAATSGARDDDPGTGPVGAANGGHGDAATEHPTDRDAVSTADPDTAGSTFDARPTSDDARSIGDDADDTYGDDGYGDNGHEGDGHGENGHGDNGHGDNGRGGNGQGSGGDPVTVSAGRTVGDAGGVAAVSATRTSGVVQPQGLPTRVPASAGYRAAEADSPEPADAHRAVAFPAGPGTTQDQVGPSQADPSQADPSQAGPSQADPSQSGAVLSGPEPATSDQDAPAAPTPGGPLPRRPVTPQSERPTSMAAAAQALTQARTAPPVPSTPTREATPTRDATPTREATPTRDATPTREAASIREVEPPYLSTGPSTPAGPHAGAPHAGASTAGAPGAGWSDADRADRTPAPPGDVDPGDDFVPANEVEQDLLSAADGGNTDIFLSTLLLATVLVPVAADSRPGSAPGEPGFGYRTEEHDGDTFLVVFTSQDRIDEHYAEPVRTHGIRFFELISGWPDRSWSFAVNPGSPVGAKLPGPQVVALASWAAEAGLGIDESGADGYERVAEPVPAPATQAAAAPGQAPTIMQKTVPPDQVPYFLDRGYDRVSGFVHRASEVEHLRTPAELHAALGLGYEGSPYAVDADQAHVLRWPAYRPSLYRIPYGGQNEQALRAMDGWVIERPPFRGNGFAPGEGRDVIAEFKVDSARLPQGAELWRIDADGGQELVAVFDCDTPVWRRVGGTDA